MYITANSIFGANSVKSYVLNGIWPIFNAVYPVYVCGCVAFCSRPRFCLEIWRFSSFYRLCCNCCLPSFFALFLPPFQSFAFRMVVLYICFSILSHSTNKQSLKSKIACRCLSIRLLISFTLLLVRSSNNYLNYTATAPKPVLISSLNFFCWGFSHCPNFVLVARVLHVDIYML